MKINRRSVIGGLLGSAGLLSAPASLLAMAGRPTDVAVPQFPGASDVGAPHPDAVLAMHLILDAVGMERRISLFSARITRDHIAGFATVVNGRRFIVYDRQRVPWPNGVTPVSSIFVIAHECGHHLGTHMHRSDVTGHAEELEGDRFAGFACSRMGLSESQATSYYQSDRAATDEHPSAADSREAAREGWLLGERMKRLELRRTMQRQ